MNRTHNWICLAAMQDTKGTSHTTQCVKQSLDYILPFSIIISMQQGEKRQRQQQPWLYWWEEAERSSTRCLWQACDSFDAQKTSTLYYQESKRCTYLYSHVWVWENCCLHSAQRTLFIMFCIDAFLIKSHSCSICVGFDSLCFALLCVS